MTDTAATDSLHPPDLPGQRKHRGAFFTPYPIAEWLAQWAIRSGASRVLDPTCGEGVFLLACARQLEGVGVTGIDVTRRLFGIDIHEMQPYRPLPEQIAAQIAEDRTIIVELDSWFLPDTAATSYRREHVKTSVAVEGVSPNNCSGAAYSGVSTCSPTRVSVSSAGGLSSAATIPVTMSSI